MQPFFSILIPFYNSEKTLNICLKSILSQNFHKSLYEIILINDCSKDKSEFKIKKILNKNKNIFLYKNKKNKGVSFSRNQGILKSKGNYIVFLDSDDLLVKNSLSQIYSYLKKLDVDFFYADNDLKFKKSMVLKKRGIKIINKLKNFNTFCWNFVVKKKFLNEYNIKFKNTRIFEDQYFVSKLLINFNKAFFIKKKFHIHNEYHDSLSKKTNNTSAISCIRSIYDLTNLVIKKNISINEKFFLKKRINFMYKNLKNYLLILEKKEIKQISAIIKKKNYNKKTIRYCNLKLFDGYNIYKNLEKFVKVKRNHLLSQIFNFIKFSNNFSKIFIFCFGNYGRFLSRILTVENIKIDGFFDNNSRLWGKKFFGIKVYNPKILKKKKYRDTLLFIGHNNTKIINIIFKQIRKYNINKKNIKNLEFRI